MINLENTDVFMETSLGKLFALIFGTPKKAVGISL